MDVSNYINSISSSANNSASSAAFANAAKGLDVNVVDKASIEAAAKEFEGMFIGQLLQFMFDTVEVDEVFGGGFAEETYRTMVVEQYGDKIAEAGGIGVSEQMQQYLLEIQMNNQN